MKFPFSFNTNTYTECYLNKGSENWKIPHGLD